MTTALKTAIVLAVCTPLAVCLALALLSRFTKK